MKQSESGTENVPIIVKPKDTVWLYRRNQPVSFIRVMFAPESPATILRLADDCKEEITQLRIIARDAAITAKLWLRSTQGTWRFFLVTPSSLTGIDRGGKPPRAGIRTDDCLNIRDYCRRG